MSQSTNPPVDDPSSSDQRPWFAPESLRAPPANPIRPTPSPPGQSNPPGQPTQWEGLSPPVPTSRPIDRVETSLDEPSPLDAHWPPPPKMEVPSSEPRPVDAVSSEATLSDDDYLEQSKRTSFARPRPGDAPAEGLWEREAAALFAAVQFLTRLPFASRTGFSAAREEEWQRDLQRGVAYFPLVGAGVGVATAVALEAAGGLWPIAIATLIALAVEALLTGALHEDAAADCCDGFGGGWTRDDVLRIMKDSRVGSYGVLGLVFTVLARFTLIISIDASFRSAAIIAAACLGRAAMTGLMLLVPPPEGTSGLSRLAAASADKRLLTIAGVGTFVGVALFLWFSPVRALGAIGLSALAATSFGLYAKGRIGGATGDVLGAACILAQIGALLAAAAIAPQLVPVVVKP